MGERWWNLGSCEFCDGFAVDLVAGCPAMLRFNKFGVFWGYFCNLQDDDYVCMLIWLVIAKKHYPVKNASLEPTFSINAVPQLIILL
jgi:hypothetical protein